MTFQQVLRKSLEEHRAHTAIESGNEKISYGTLLHTADTITRYLLPRLPGKETLIGIASQDRVHIICSIIGVLNAGGVFVLLDTSLPATRLGAIIKDLDLQYLIKSADTPVHAFSSVEKGKQYRYEEILAGQAPSHDIGYPQYGPADSVYIFFTSGSTGKPKGIVGKNDSLLQFIQWEQQEFAVDETSRFSQLISPWFDAFLRDIFVPLFSGGTICIAQKEDIDSPDKMVAWLDRAGISHIHCVPSQFRIFNNEHLTAAHFSHLKYIMLSGEKIIPLELAGWYNTIGPRVQLVNFYGATETTMIRSRYYIQPGDTRLSRIPVGTPIPGTELVVSDNSHLKPLGKLVTGDLFIISNYVTKGYLNNPELTHEKFLQPDQPVFEGKIAFHTGDKARAMPDGQVDLLGREDRQIKVRGIRIEPDEIELALMRSNLVRKAMVLKHTAENNDEMLVAFVCKANDGDEQEYAALLRAFLSDTLPAYMVPSRIVFADEFPLLANGKINYNALLNNLATKENIAPVNKTEAILLAIWKEILGDKPVSANDDFFNSGGSSISIMRLIGKIYKEFGVRISLNDIFNNPTIRQQAQLIDKSGKDSLLFIPKATERPFYNLSLSQLRIYYYYELNKADTAFNMPMCWEVRGKLDIDRLERCLQALIERHESLRTAIRFVNGNLAQVISNDFSFNIEVYEAKHQSIQESISAFVRPFDLSIAPLIRCAIIFAGNYKTFIVLDMHHVACDGLSQSIFFSDFLQLYRGGQLTALPLQYKDYCEWESAFKTTDQYLSHREFWLKSFEGSIPKLDLPTIAPGTYDAAGPGRNVIFTIGKEEIGPLLEFFKANSITAFSGWLAIYFIYLSLLTGQEDIVVGINTSGKMQDELEGVVGMFTKTLPIRYQPDIGKTYRQLVTGLHAYLMEAYQKQCYDLADILGELNRSRAVPLNRLFDVMFVYLDFENTCPDDEMEFISYQADEVIAKYPLTMFANDNGQSVTFRLEYMTELFAPADITVLIGQFRLLVKTISENLDANMKDYAGNMAGPVPSQHDDISFSF